MPLVPTVPLPNSSTPGATVPVVGLGCWMGEPGKTGENTEAYEMVKEALKVGYRSFDTAAGYGNEEAVGRAIKESSIPREEIFVTTKLGGSYHGRVAEAFENSLKELDLGYIDLYLVHWPQANDPVTGEVVPKSQSPTIPETWAQMEKLVETGKVRSIGVSNYSVQNLELLLKTAKIVPAVNQIESHPFLPQTKEVAFCKTKGIHLTAYCPLGQYNSPILADPAVKAIAEKLSETTGQVLLNWGIQRGDFSVVPKSSNPGRMAQNLDLFEIPEEDFKTISALHEQAGKHTSLCKFTFGDGPDPVTKDGVIGWSYDDMGWDKEAFKSHWE